MVSQYMYLVFARSRFYEVRSGAEVVRVDAENQEDAIKKYFQDHAESTMRASFNRKTTEWDEKLRKFKAGVKVDPFTTKEGSVGSRYRVFMVRLTFPDGAVDECRAVDRDERTEAAFRSKNGDRPATPANLLHDWRTHANPTAQLRRGWTVTSFGPDDNEKEIDDDLSQWQFGAPLKGIVVVLNRLATEGWTVVSSAEDKGLYKGEDATNESFPARMRYLLARTVVDGR